VKNRRPCSRSAVTHTQPDAPEVKVRDRIRELRRVPARELVPNPENWRLHPKAQAAALRGLLAELGIADAVLARELADGRLMLVDGHLRKEVSPNALLPVLVLDLDEAEADKLLLAMDPLSAMAEGDSDRIKSLLATVRTDNEAVQELLRRTAGNQIWNALYPEHPTDTSALIDKAGELQRKWRTEPKQLWLIGGHKLLCGDSTDPEEVRRLMGDERAVLFATDPPYSVGYTGGSHPQSISARER
jgi:hypothetical protein